jgi:hypothetical protein
MNLDELRRKLIGAARKGAQDHRVPYGFEKRIMARLREASSIDRWGLWAQALWRATAPCIGLALLLAVWSLVTPTSTPAPSATGGFDVAQEFENTVLAAADQEVSLE